MPYIGGGGVVLTGAGALGAGAGAGAEAGVRVRALIGQLSDSAGL